MNEEHALMSINEYKMLKKNRISLWMGIILLFPPKMSDFGLCGCLSPFGREDPDREGDDGPDKEKDTINGSTNKPEW